MTSASATLVMDRVSSLAKSCGGWERLLADLPATDRARLAVRLSDAAVELERRAADAEAARLSSVRDAVRDPGTLAAAAAILKAAGWKIEPPK